MKLTAFLGSPRRGAEGAVLEKPEVLAGAIEVGRSLGGWSRPKRME